MINTKFNKKNGFTLAEVLITLGIVGIVAALTIPTIFNAVFKHKTEVTLKKAYNTMANALRRAQVDHDDTIFWDNLEIAQSGNEDIVKKTS